MSKDLGIFALNLTDMEIEDHFIGVYFIPNRLKFNHLESFARGLMRYSQISHGLKRYYSKNIYGRF